MTPAERDEVRRIASGFFACEPKDALTMAGMIKLCNAALCYVPPAAMLAGLDMICDGYGLEPPTNDQFKFIVAIHLLATVAQRAGLTKEYAMGRISEMVPRAMDASEADEHIDIHAGGVSS